jgi:hypothetical protein
MLNKLISRCGSIMSLTHRLKYKYVDDFDDHIIKPVNLKTPKQYYKQLYKNPKLNPFPQMHGSFYDVLYMPGLDK